MSAHMEQALCTFALLFVMVSLHGCGEEAGHTDVPQDSKWYPILSTGDIGGVSGTDDGSISTSHKDDGVIGGVSGITDGAIGGVTGSDTGDIGGVTGSDTGGIGGVTGSDTGGIGSSQASGGGAAITENCAAFSNCQNGKCDSAPKRPCPMGMVCAGWCDAHKCESKCVESVKHYKFSCQTNRVCGADIKVNGQTYIDGAQSVTKSKCEELDDCKAYYYSTAFNHGYLCSQAYDPGGQFPDTSMYCPKGKLISVSIDKKDMLDKEGGDGGTALAEKVIYQ